MPSKEDADGSTSEFRSLREIASQVNNEKDFKDYILSYSGNVSFGLSSEVKYERHPVGIPKAATNNTFRPNW